MTGNALIGHTSLEELICHSASYSGRLDPRRSNLDSSSNSKHTTKTKFMFQDRDLSISNRWFIEQKHNQWSRCWDLVQAHKSPASNKGGFPAHITWHNKQLSWESKSNDMDMTVKWWMNSLFNEPFHPTSTFQIKGTAYWKFPAFLWSFTFLL
jgi:hypothetical protein